jgi:hypothetical protein
VRPTLRDMGVPKRTREEVVMLNRLHYIALAGLLMVQLSCSNNDNGTVAQDTIAAEVEIDAAKDVVVDEEVESEDLIEPDDELRLAADPKGCASDDDCSLLASYLGPCEQVACDVASGLCGVLPKSDGLDCDDQDACTAVNYCKAGVCVGEGALQCDDGNPCTTDQCSPTDGCLFAPFPGYCDDGNECTPNDQCVDGLCVSGDSQCDCDTDLDCAPYEDGDLCNGTLICESTGNSSTCVLDTQSVVACSGETGSPCSTNSCVPATGLCVVTPAGDGGACDDNNACSFGDHCEGLQCVVSGALDCDDLDPCTKDECDPADGCSHAPLESCEDCDGFQCLGCNYGNDCSPGGPYLGEGCCSQGDALVKLSEGKGDEAVDLESDGKYVWVCGGFGVRVSDITNPQDPKLKGSATSRCQRIGLGPVLENGSRVFYLTHHGDSFVKAPHLWTYHLTASGKLELKKITKEANVLYEGMAWSDGHLYVAAHESGLKVYSTDPIGIPSPATTVDGFVNAWKVDAEEGYLYVADANGGVKVLSAAQPGAPVHVASLETSGSARDVEAYGDRLYVALGGDGVDIFDIAVPSAPVLKKHLDTLGSVQAVARDGDLLAFANWSHVELRDANTLHLLATEHTRHFPEFEQSLGIVVHDDNVFVAEWEGLHVLQHVPGLVAPDIFVQDDLLLFKTDVPNARALIIRNLGLLDLVISDIEVDGPGDFEFDKTALTVGPGEAGVVEIVFYPPAGGGSFNDTSILIMTTNDIDEEEATYEMPLVAATSGSKIDVGDSLDASFGFLDPNGLDNVNGLKGKVVVLTYFALF